MERTTDTSITALPVLIQFMHEQIGGLVSAPSSPWFSRGYGEPALYHVDVLEGVYMNGEPFQRTNQTTQRLGLQHSTVIFIHSLS